MVVLVGKWIRMILAATGDPLIVEVDHLLQWNTIGEDHHQAIIMVGEDRHCKIEGEDHHQWTLTTIIAGHPGVGTIGGAGLLVLLTGATTTTGITTEEAVVVVVAVVHLGGVPATRREWYTSIRGKTSAPGWKIVVASVLRASRCGTFLPQLIKLPWMRDRQP